MAVRTERALLFAVVATMATMLLVPRPAGPLHASAGVPQNDNTDLIRRSCSSTLYPSLCYTSLAPYASVVGQDPARLARVAANVSLAQVRSVSSHMSSILQRLGERRLDKRTASALQDCKETLSNAADLTRKAIAELGLLRAAKGNDVAWRVSNAQTWMSAALTNEDTCVDGFAAVAGSAVKVDVCRWVQLAKQYTGNALALVNRLVHDP